MAWMLRLIHISIHALHEESDITLCRRRDTHLISIHALHEESDHHLHTKVYASCDISIHALHEESDWPYTPAIPAFY